MNPNEEHNEEQELKEMAPTLFGIHKVPEDGRGGLSAPNGYFDNLASRIQDRVQETTPEKESLFSRIFKKKVVWALPVVAAITAVVWISVRGNDVVEDPVLAEEWFREGVVVNDMDDMTVNELVEEITTTSIEEEEVNLLDAASEDVLLASLDEDEFFEDFFETDFEVEDDEQASVELTEEDLESIENYFSADADDFDLGIIVE